MTRRAYINPLPGYGERHVDCLTTDDIFQPIVSLSTTDKTVVDLLVGDRVMTGYFDSAQGRWMVNGGKTPIPEGLYPTHWRPFHPDAD